MIGQKILLTCTLSAISLCLILCRVAGLGQVFYEPPKIHYRDLYGSQAALIEALREDGMVVVDNIPELRQLRERALYELANCVTQMHAGMNSEDAQVEGVRKVVLNDGTQRFTIATSSLGRAHGMFSKEVEKECPGFILTSSTLRSVISKITEGLVHTIEEGVDAQQSFTWALNEGEHLEHFHVYKQRVHKEGRGPSENGEHKHDKDNSAPTLDMHTDVGILLSMIPALYLETDIDVTRSGETGNLVVKQSGHYDRIESGLFVQLHNGLKQQVRMPLNGILFMIGEGANQWLNVPVKLHAPLHAMVMPNQKQYSQKNSQTNYLAGFLLRAWYGCMLLPPQNAVAVGANKGLPFDQFQKIAMRKLQSHSSSNLPETVACGNRMLLTDSKSCKEGDIYCWMQCMPTEKLNCSASEAKCMSDSGGMWPKDTGQMCPDCHLVCPAPVERKKEYCNTEFEPITMYMTGFQFGPDKNVPCILFLFPGWVIDDAYKLAMAFIGTMLLGVFVEYLSYARYQLRSKLRLPSITRCKAFFCESGGVVLLAMQALFGYLMMLVAMTYKGELLIALVVGLSTGHAIFQRFTGIPSSPEPCCNLTVNDENEREVANGSKCHLDRSNSSLSHLSRKGTLEVEESCKLLSNSVSSHKHEEELNPIKKDSL